MKYLEKSFSVGGAPSDAYRDNWDRIFGRKAPEMSSDGGTFTDPDEIWKECPTHPGTKFVYASRCPLCIQESKP